MNTARDIIEIQYNGQMSYARLTSTFRATMGNETLSVSELFYLIHHIQNYDVKVRLERPYCTIHCPPNFVVSSTFDMPFVRLPLQRFSENVHFLLAQHTGTMPLGRYVLPFRFTTQFIRIL